MLKDVALTFEGSGDPNMTSESVSHVCALSGKQALKWFSNIHIPFFVLPFKWSAEKLQGEIGKSKMASH